MLFAQLFSRTSQKSPHYYRGKFHNKWEKKDHRSLINFLTLLCKESPGSWPKWVENKATPKIDTCSNYVNITFLNHASFLIHVSGKYLLFDPVFANRVGPIPRLGLKRRRPPGMALKDLPPIDFVFVSHNHYDHLDLHTLRYLSKRDQTKFIVPLGDKDWLQRAKINNVYELDWWQSLLFDDLHINFVPAQHASGRGLFDQDQSFWGGFVIEHPNVTLFHAGDTGYCNHFKEIGDKFAIDIAMLPMGSYEPRWLLERVHMGPKEAVQAHKELNAKQSFGMHCDTFRLSSVSYLEAHKELAKILSSDREVKNRFCVLDVGESRNYALQKNT